jgi:hypothetical protein
MVGAVFRPEAAASELEAQAYICDLSDAAVQRVFHHARKQRQRVLPWYYVSEFLEQVHEANACFVVLAGAWRAWLEIGRTATGEELVTRGSGR